MTENEFEARKKRRRRRDLIIIVILLVAAIVILWGWSATGGSYLQVKQLTDQRSQLENGTSSLNNKDLEVQGVVAAWSGGMTFTLQDKNNAIYEIAVNSSASIPQGFTNGKAVVIKGVVHAGSPLTLQAQGITVGCSSKY
jgi:cytochrome c-type biogenesis protein CcmE